MNPMQRSSVSPTTVVTTTAYHSFDGNSNGESSYVWSDMESGSLPSPKRKYSEDFDSDSEDDENTKSSTR